MVAAGRSEGRRDVSEVVADTGSRVEEGMPVVGEGRLAEEGRRTVEVHTLSEGMEEER